MPLYSPNGSKSQGFWDVLQFYLITCYSAQMAEKFNKASIRLQQWSKATLLLD